MEKRLKTKTVAVGLARAAGLDGMLASRLIGHGDLAITNVADAAHVKALDAIAERLTGGSQEEETADPLRAKLGEIAARKGMTVEEWLEREEGSN